jgi:ATP-dependent protease ClpP protease subunit
MTAEEAREYGLIDEVLHEEEEDEKKKDKNSEKKDG